MDSSSQPQETMQETQNYGSPNKETSTSAGTACLRRDARRRLVSGVYVLLAVLYAVVSVASQSRSLRVLCAVLSYDACVLAMGGIFVRWRALLEFLGRVRFFVDALAWPYFLSFAIAVSGKCGFLSYFSVVSWEMTLGGLFYVLTIVFVGREVMYYAYVLWDPTATRHKILANLSSGGNIGPTGHYEQAQHGAAGKQVTPPRQMMSPPSAIEMADTSEDGTRTRSNDVDIPSSCTSTSPEDRRRGGTREDASSSPQMRPRGRNMPDSHLSTLVGSFDPAATTRFSPQEGQLPVKADFGDCLPRNAVFGGYFRPLHEEADDGRLIFVPVPARDGLYIASGLVMLEHLWLGCVAFLAQTPHALPPLFVGAAAGLTGRLVERRIPNVTLARLVIRASELLWMVCCLMQERCLCVSQMFSFAMEPFTKGAVFEGASTATLGSTSP
ncbi:unnamed protein product [Amoebophrya sp. A25]|nr:unnamed protein product [Amoebophrya sp. A25]|eukprot:GSA25T00026988001.1